MPYQSTTGLESQIEGLRSANGRGLIQSLRNYKAGKLEKQLGQKTSANDQVRQEEMANILKGMQTGRVGDTYTARSYDDYQATHPEVQQLQMAEALKSSQAEQQQERAMALKAAPNAPSAGTQTPETFGAPSYFEDDQGNVRIAQAGNRGTFSPTDTGDLTPLLPGSQAGFRQENIAEQETARTAAEVANLLQTLPISNDLRVQLEQELQSVQTQGSGERGALTQNITRHGELMDQAQMAYESIEALDRFLDASATAPAGTLQPVVSEIQRFVSSFGGDPEGLTEITLMEMANAEQLGAYMRSMGARGLTDSDMAVLARTLPRLNSGKEGREEVARVLKDIQQRRIDEFDTSYQNFDEGIRSRLATPSWYQQSSGSGDPELDAILEAINAAQ